MDITFSLTDNQVATLRRMMISANSALPDADKFPNAAAFTRHLLLTSLLDAVDNAKWTRAASIATRIRGMEEADLDAIEAILAGGV